MHVILLTRSFVPSFIHSLTHSLTHSVYISPFQGMSWRSNIFIFVHRYFPHSIFKAKSTEKVNWELPVLGPTQPPNYWVPGALSPGVKWPLREAEHSPPRSSEVRNAWSYTSTPQYAFMAWSSVQAQGQR